MATQKAQAAQPVILTTVSDGKRVYEMEITPDVARIRQPGGGAVLGESSLETVAGLLVREWVRWPGSIGATK